jgi:hypothetical protein
LKDFAPNTLGLKVLTPDGYKGFEGIALMGEKPIYRLEFGNRKHLECSASHRLITPEGALMPEELRVGQPVYIGNGKTTRIKSVIFTGEMQPVYDIVGVEGDATYVTSGVVSHNCEFITDDETLINPLMLTRMVGISPDFYTGTVRWFKQRDWDENQLLMPNRTYLVALDPSLGTGSDYSAIQVFMLPEMVQVGEWQHNKTNPRGQVRRLMQILMFIDATLRDDPDQHGDPEIYWTVENNTIGETILMTIEDTGEERFPGTFVTERKRKGQSRRVRKGMHTDNRKKLAACARFKNLVETDRLKIMSGPLIRELKNFVHKEASFGAKPGEHDDLTMSTLLVVRMLDVVLHWGADAGDLKEYIGDDELFEQDAMPVVI